MASGSARARRETGIPDAVKLCIQATNISGLGTRPNPNSPMRRWQLLLRDAAEHDVAIHAISETHYDRDKQALFDIGLQGTPWRAVWGAPAPPRTCGVALLFDTRQVAAQAVPILDPDAQLLYNLARLLAVQVWPGSGRRSLMVYVCYGDVNNANERHRLVQAVRNDATARHPLAIPVPSR